LDEINGFLGSNKISHNTESAMQLVARGTDRINHHYAALASMLVACFAVWAFGATAASPTPSEATLQLEPRKAAVKEGEVIGVTLVFVGGAHETTLTLPMGADPSGIITYLATEVPSGKELIGA